VGAGQELFSEQGFHQPTHWLGITGDKNVDRWLISLKLQDPNLIQGLWAFTSINFG
jgi:hypothetical protein